MIPIEQMKRHKEFVCHLIEQHNIKKFAEIGVYKTKSMNHILREVGNRLDEYWAVDPWEPLPDDDGPMGTKTKEEWEEFYQKACGFKKKYPQVHVLRMTSLEAAKLFKEPHFDFVYIDANHFYEDVLNDIQAWRPLIKEGGILGGHDYRKNRYSKQVQKAVHECFGEAKIKRGADGVWFTEL